MRILRSIVARESELQADGRPTDFIMVQMVGPSFGLKPGIPGEQELSPQESDILELVDAGCLRDLGPSSSSAAVLLRFAVTSQGRVTGSGGSVARDLSQPLPQTPPPSADDVLAWVKDLSASAEGAQALEDGGGFMSNALATWGEDHRRRVAAHLFDLTADGLLTFEDPMARIDQMDEVDRLGMAANLRLTASGRDRAARLERRDQPAGASPLQIVIAEHAQIAARDINNNYANFDELLDLVRQGIETMEGIDDDTRDEAKSFVERLRGSAGTLATGTATGAGGAVVGALLKSLLGL